MILTLKGVVLALSSSLAVSIVAKATVALALTFLVTWPTRRSRAAVRHALLAAAFGVLLVLPIASLIAPPIRVAVLLSAQDRTPMTPVAGSIQTIQPAALADAGVGVPAVAPLWSRLSLSAPLLTAWITGVALFLLPVVLGLWQVRSLCQSGLPWPYGQSSVEALAREVGIHRSVKVRLSDCLLSDALPGPMTCGVIHPAIVLPPDAHTWEADDLNRAILHELEHVRRGDWVIHCLARVVCAVYWFHPLVWIAWRQLELEAERSCDDAVLRRSEATAYADQLVEFARRLSLAAKRPATRSPILAMANRAHLARRVGAVLDNRQQRGRAGAFRVGLACAAAALLVLAMAPLTMVGAPPQHPPSAGAVPTPPPAVVTAPPARPARPSFEVVTIRPSQPGTFNYLGFPPGRILARGVPLWSLIITAYGIHTDLQLAGTPPWSKSELYDVEGKADGNPGFDTLLLMLQTLLEDRFQFRYHWETKQLPVYALVASKPAKLHEDEGDCAPAQPGPGPPLKPEEMPRSCGLPVMFPGRLSGQKVKITQLLSILSTLTTRPVVDRTGLTGKYDIALQWAPLPGQFEPPPGFKPPPGLDPEALAPADPNWPPLSIALQQQLGLKLKSQKGPVRILVVDHAEKPSTN
jgi:bla regulator protein blaR1